MVMLTAREVLELWDHEAAAPAERALLPLAASAGHDLPALARLPLGRRDALLLELYRGTFGPELELGAECPECGERVEVELAVDELLADPGAEPDASWELQRDRLALRFRAPNSDDLAAVAGGGGDAETARRALLARCLLDARRGDEPIAAAELDAEELELVAARMAAVDPLAELLLEVRCEVCGHAWPALVDVAECFWHQLAVVARRLVAEIHTLARAYGWREDDVLALSPHRRRTYLEMVIA